MIRSRDADSADFTFSGVQQKRIGHDTLDTVWLGDLVAVRTVANSAVGVGKAEVGAAAVVLDARVCPIRIRFGVNSLDTHQVLVVDEKNSIVFAGQLVGAFYRVLLPVGPVDVIAENAEAERMVETFFDDHPSPGTVCVDHLDLVAFGIAEVQVLKVDVDRDAVGPADLIGNDD